MRALSVLGLAALLALVDPALAQEPPGPEIFENFDLEAPAPSPSDEPAAGEPDAAPGSEIAPSRAERIDALFERLKRERSPEAAEAIAADIQAAWLESGSATVDLLMGWAGEAMGRAQNGAALDLIEQAMVLAPDYAEAWNARATLNFQTSNYGRSIADIEQTLAREPRHFGALMGLAAILEEVGRPEEAFEAYRRVLEVYPSLRGAQDAAGRLAAEIGGTSL